MEVIGLDIGFGFTKATNGKRSLVFKSVYGEASDMQFREQLLAAPAKSGQTAQTAQTAPPMLPVHWQIPIR